MNKDYGIKLKALGISRKTDLYFPYVQLIEFFELGHQNFTTMVAHNANGETFSLSFDFSINILDQISVKVKSEEIGLIRDSNYIYRLIFDQAIYVSIKARLGIETKDSDGNAFIPLVIDEIQ